MPTNFSPTSVAPGLSAWEKFARRLNLPRQPSHGERFRRLVEEARQRGREIDAPTAACLVEAGALLIDVRERGEYAQRHAVGAEHLARGTIEGEIERYAPDATTPLVCYCSDGYRSALVAENLQRMGYQNVQILAGGLRAWIAAGLRTASEREAMD